MKWDWLLNIDTIIFIVIFIAVVWCVINKKHKPPNSKFSIDNLDLKSLFASKSKSRLWKKYRVPKKLLKKKRFNKSEEKCREIFENIYKVKFNSIRPDFLKNPTTGKNLELDGYASNIATYLGEGLAFEYDGIQHSKHTGAFHRGKSDFKYQCAKDRWKDMRCKELGIMLIRIPHFVAYHDLETYIIEKLKKKGVYLDKVRIINNNNNNNSNISSYYNYNLSGNTKSNTLFLPGSSLFNNNNDFILSGKLYD